MNLLGCLFILHMHVCMEENNQRPYHIHKFRILLTNDAAFCAYCVTYDTGEEEEGD